MDASAKATPPITFDVSDVTLDRELLAASSLAHQLDARGVRNVLAATTNAELVEASPLNAFVMAMHVAYTRHRPLTLTPDAVWLAIAQGLARHIDVHAERLRGRLVRHTGKIALEARRDELALDPSSTREWSIAVSILAEQVTEHLGGRARLFVADFSTTDACSLVASQITLLGAVQSYFEYSVATLCGIPRITLAGTPEDWSAIRARLHIFDELDVGWWKAKLDPVLAEFEIASRGKPSRKFWERAYKVHDASGGEAISGWVNAFFPYEGELGATRSAWFEHGDDASEFHLPKLASFPSGIASAPFTWKLLDGDHPMCLLAGFVGVGVEGEGVAPAIGWAVAPAVADRIFRAHPYDARVALSPRVPSALTSLAGLAEEIASDGHARVELSLWMCTSLASLEGIATISAIDSLSILSCNALESLAPLTHASSIRNLRVQQCDKISDLAPLGAMTELRTLGVTHCPNVRDFRPLTALRNLEMLDLFGDAVPAEIRGRHRGRDAIDAVMKRIAARS